MGLGVIFKGIRSFKMILKKTTINFQQLPQPRNILTTFASRSYKIKLCLVQPSTFL